MCGIISWILVLVQMNPLKLKIKNYTEEEKNCIQTIKWHILNAIVKKVKQGY